MGRPKALVEVDGVPWARRSAAVLRAAGCRPVVVVLGAGAEQAAALLDDDVTVVVAPDWAHGMGASLRAGLAALAEVTNVTAAVVHLVDLPGVTTAAIDRLRGGATADRLARAAYDGRPGHPVLLGRSHWAAIAATASGDAGARDYLGGRPDLVLVECADVADGTDVDTPQALRATARRAP